VNYPDKDGNTALHLAAYNGHADVVATLLDSGQISDLTIQNNYNETVLDMAKGAQKAYSVKKEHKGPKSLALPKPGALKNTCIDFTTRNGWPGWEEIIRLLEAEQQEKERIKRVLFPAAFSAQQKD
jgi:ankyrin repeat protein